MIQNLVQMEFFQLAFPFLLSLAIIYGVLQTKAGDLLPKSARGLVAIVLSFFVMLYSAATPILYTTITSISGPFLMIAVALLFLIIIFSMVGIDIKTVTDWSWKTALLAAIIVFVIASLAFGSAGFIGMPFGLNSSDLWSFLFFLIIMGVVLHYLRKEDGGGSKPSSSKPG